MTHLLTFAGVVLMLGGCAFGAGGLLQPLNPVIASITADDLEVPYVPTPEPMVAAMLDLAEVGAADYLIDLGAGDGRIVIAAAQRGAGGLGVEIDAALVAQAASAARRAGVGGQVAFRRQDLFTTPLHKASVVALYLLPEMNLRLRPRLLTELRPGARIVSHAFNMGDWRPDAHRVVDGRNAYLWIVPAVAAGQWTLTSAEGATMLLALEQRFQDVTGTLTSEGRIVPLTEVTLRGDRLRFTADGRRYGAIIDGAQMRPDRAGGGEAGWQATRVE